MKWPKGVLCDLCDTLAPSIKQDTFFLVRSSSSSQDTMTRTMTITFFNVIETARIGVCEKCVKEQEKQNIKKARRHFAIGILALFFSIAWIMAFVVYNCEGLLAPICSNKEPPTFIGVPVGIISILVMLWAYAENDKKLRWDTSCKEALSKAAKSALNERMKELAPPLGGILCLSSEEWQQIQRDCQK